MTDMNDESWVSELCFEEQITFIIAECVAVMEDSGVSVGREKMADVLKGKPSRFILEGGYDANPAFGRLEFLRLADVRFFIQALIDDGVLVITSAGEKLDLPVLGVAERVGPFLWAGRPIESVSHGTWTRRYSVPTRKSCTLSVTAGWSSPSQRGCRRS